MEMARSKTEDLALLLLVALAFIGRGPFAGPAPSGGGSSGADSSRPNIDPSTGRPNNSNTPPPDMSGSNTRSGPAVDPFASNAGDKSTTITPPFSSPAAQIPVQLTDPNARAYSQNYAAGNQGGIGQSFLNFFGGIGQAAGMFAGQAVTDLSGVGKTLMAMFAPFIGARPLIPEVFAQSGGVPMTTNPPNPAQEAAQKATANLIMLRPDLTYSTGFAGGQQGPTFIGNQFTRNSVQESVAIKNETQRSLALAQALGYATGNLSVDPKSSVYATKEGYGYFDKITGMWI